MRASSVRRKMLLTWLAISAAEGCGS